MLEHVSNTRRWYQGSAMKACVNAGMQLAFFILLRSS